MRKIILSKRAAVKLEKLLDYLETQWSEKAKHDFIQKLDKSLDLIKEYPESNEKSSIKKDLYRCVITRQTTLYYQYNTNAIKVIALFDSRMNPGKIKTEVS